MRNESLKWVYERKDEIKKAEHPPCVVPLTSCLVDKDAKVRKEAEKVIVEVIPFVGKDPFMKQV